MNKPVKKSQKGRRQSEARLIVADAKYRDEGLGTAALTKKIRKQLGVSPGDIIGVGFGGKLAAVRVSDSYYPMDEKNDYIRLEKHTREKLGIVTGEEVTVTRPAIRDAETVILMSMNRMPMAMPFPVDWNAYFKGKLKGNGVIIDTSVKIPFFGMDFELEIYLTAPPKGIVKVTDSTNVILEVARR